MNEELNKSVETALAAFSEVKGMVDGFGKKLNDITPKMDAFDQAKFEKMSKDIGDAIELSQKEQAARKALEEQQKAQVEQYKALETELSEVKTAFNRQATGGAEDKGKETDTLFKKHFNQFARISDANKVGFSQHLKSNITDEMERKALSVGSDPDGGYMVIPEFGGIIQTKVFESSPIRQLASVITINTDTYEFMLDNGEADGEWVGEGSSGNTETTPTLGKKSIAVHELAAKPKATQKMLDDGIVDVENWLAGKVGDIFARLEATAFVTGNGIVKPRGILSYSNGTDIGQEQIEQVVTGSANGFTYDGMVDIQNALKEPYQANASWLYKRATNANIMKLKDGEGRPIFNMTYDKNVGLRPTLLGQPTYFGNDIPAVSSGALAMVYGDIKAAYQIVDRIGIRVLRDPYTSKGYVVFYTTKRVGGAVVNYEAVKIGKVATA